MAAVACGFAAMVLAPALAAPPQPPPLPPALKTDTTRAETSKADAPMALAADVATPEGRTEVRLTLSKPVAAAAFVLEKPDRVVVDLPEVSFRLPPESGRSKIGLAAAMRFGLVAPGRSRMVVDLAGPAAPTRTEIETGPDGLPVLVVELTRVDRETFRRLAAAANRGAGITTTGSIAAASEPPLDRRPIVVLDAGHGGGDPGAIAPTGEQEKDIVLAFVEQLRDALKAGGRYRLSLSRDTDVFVPLDERVRRARAAGAALFISIHADSIASPTISGATIYTGAERASDAESATLAERENQSDAVAGHAPREGPAEIADILADLTQRETRGFSRRFAGQLHGELGRSMRFSAQPHREAGFRVLRSGDIPAVLVELGYLSNARDVSHLISEDWRRQAAAAMAGAVDRFFAERSKGPKAAAVSP